MTTVSEGEAATGGADVPAQSTGPDPATPDPAVPEQPAGRFPGLARLGRPSRRDALLLGAGLLGGAALGGGVAGLETSRRLRVPPAPVRDDEETLNAREGRERLEAGNARFVAGTSLHPDQGLARRGATAATQKPFAAVLTCTDSRVPPELVFDQGLGDLVVVRSAGPVLDRAVLGSLQYAVEYLEVPLLVVLGHSQCGTVKAAIDALERKLPASHTDLDVLNQGIAPAVEEARKIGAKEKNLLQTSIDINVDRLVDTLKEAPLIEDAALLRRVKVLGATYSVRTGEVDWA